MGKNKKNVLCIVGSMNVGGAETFLMKLFRSIDKNNYSMDFIVSIKDEGAYDQEIKDMGGKIYYVTPKSLNPILSVFQIYKIVKNNHYHSVMRIGDNSLSAIDLVAAKCGGANKLIFRSSNSSTSGGIINQILHKLFILVPRIVANVKLAPSSESAVFMFGKELFEKGEVEIINNAVDLNKFQFNSVDRDVLRKKFDIDNKFVVGHVGRFNSQKNHLFLIDIFYEIYNKKNDSILILVGIGELENEIKKKINSLNLQDKVILTGIRSDVDKIMMAMDMFIFPSYYEGMPNTVIEAQATGLPCIVSDSITKEVSLTKLVDFMSISDKPKIWAEKAVSYNLNKKRQNVWLELRNKGYDIQIVAKKMESIIFE